MPTITLKPMKSVLTEYVIACEVIKQAEAKKDQLRPLIEDRFGVGDHSYEGFLIRRLSTTRTNLDREALKRKLGFDYDAFTTESTSISLSVREEPKED